MLNVDSVSGLSGERRLITALSFTVQRGRLLAVTVQNGSGKTSSPRSVEARRMSLPDMLAALREIIWRDMRVTAGAGAVTHLSLLGAGLLLARALAPWATATSSRIALE